MDNENKMFDNNNADFSNGFNLDDETVPSPVFESKGEEGAAETDFASFEPQHTPFEAKAQNTNFNESQAALHSPEMQNMNVSNDERGAFAPDYGMRANQNEMQRRQIYINSNAPFGDFNSGTDRAPYAKRATYEKKAKDSKKQRSIKTNILVIALCAILSFGAAFGGTVLASRFTKENSADRKPLKIEQSTQGQNVNQTELGNTQLPTTDSNAYSVVVSKVADSVVEIRTETVSTNSIFSQYITEGAGSGVIISEDGYIITNNHVIEDAATITVYTTDSKKYAAELIGADEESDLAVLKIEAEGLTNAVFGDSSKLAVGQEVIAIGNPLGSLGGTVTNGIISALAREVSISGTPMTLLQTNAAVNPGNSGGGLFNLNGELVGIVNAKSSGSGIEGLGFAIPSNVAKEVAEYLAEFGYVRGRVTLGIEYIDIKDSYTAMMYRVDSYGMYIIGSEHNDELKVGDRITAADGNVITYSSDMKKIIKDCKVGDKITLTVIRDGKYIDVEVECHEYIPSSTEKNTKLTDDNVYDDFFDMPFSDYFGF